MELDWLRKPNGWQSLVATFEQSAQACGCDFTSSAAPLTLATPPSGALGVGWCVPGCLGGWGCRLLSGMVKRFREAPRLRLRSSRCAWHVFFFSPWTASGFSISPLSPLAPSAFPWRKTTPCVCVFVCHSVVFMFYFHFVFLLIANCPGPALVLGPPLRIFLPPLGSIFKRIALHRSMGFPLTSYSCENQNKHTPAFEGNSKVNSFEASWKIPLLMDKS